MYLRSAGVHLPFDFNRCFVAENFSDLLQWSPPSNLFMLDVAVVTVVVSSTYIFYVHRDEKANTATASNDEIEFM